MSTKARDMKDLPALLTFTVLLAGMGPLMPTEVRALPEAFPALWARIRLLTCVCPLVFNKGSTLAEAFPTCLALIGLLTCVGPLVFKEVRALSEPLLTAVTFVGFVLMEPQTTVNRVVRFRRTAFHMEALFVVIPIRTSGTETLCCLDVLTKAKAGTVPKFITLRNSFFLGHTDEMRDGSASLLFRRTLELQQYSVFWQLFFPVLNGIITLGK